MARGELVKALDKQAFDGTAVYDIVFPGIQLGQSSTTVFDAAFNLYGDRPESVLLDIAVSLGSVSRPAGFRIESNGVTISREFKPSMCINADGRVICRLVYDVTPIVKSKNASEVKVKVENFGVNPISLEHVGVIGLQNVEGALSDIMYYTGALVLEPMEVYRIELGKNIRNARVHLVAYIPHSSANIEVNGRSVTGVGFGEHVVHVGDITSIEIGYHGRPDVYPRSAIITSLLVVGGNIPRPRIETRLRRVNTQHAEVEIVNAGTAPAENVIVVSISRGIIVERKVLGRVEPGQHRIAEIKIKEDSSIIRVIWRYMGEVSIREIRL